MNEYSIIWHNFKIMLSPASKASVAAISALEGVISHGTRGPPQGMMPRCLLLNACVVCAMFVYKELYTLVSCQCLCNQRVEPELFCLQKSPIRRCQNAVKELRSQKVDRTVSQRSGLRNRISPTVRTSQSSDCCYPTTSFSKVHM